METEFAREESVGIKCFIDMESTPIQGILKHRYTDFCVNEIGLDAVECCWDEDKPVDDQSLIDEMNSVNEECTREGVSDALMSLLDDPGLISDIWALFKAKGSSDSGSNKSAVTNSHSILQTAPFTSKDEKTRIHQQIRQLFKGTLCTQSNEDGTISIFKRSATNAATHSNSLNNNPKRANRNRRDNRNTQPINQHKFMRFILRKENIDTLDAIQQISRRLHMNPRDFSFAGTKDRRGVTCQWVVARGVTVNKLLGINKLFEGKLKVCRISKTEGPLSLGDLRGNRFRIVIRNIQCPDDDATILERCSRFATNGFINYFGLQRFGNASAGGSHQIGQCLLQGKYEEAIDLILMPRGEESDERIASARQKWQSTRDPQDCAGAFPRKCQAEAAIIAHLCNHGRDFLGAIGSVRRELRLMYVHSVQSLIWNATVSDRMEKHGQSLLIGDFVCVKDKDHCLDLVDSDVGADSCEMYSETTAKLDRKQSLIVITEENIEEFTFEDLVLPIPGHQSELPDNDSGAFMLSMLRDLLSSAEDGNDEEKSNDSWRQKMMPSSGIWDLSGSIRKVFVAAKEPQFSIKHYASQASTILHDENMVVEDDVVGEENGEYRALCASFTLPPSSYATMAIRELLHSGTDPRQHSLHTAEHRK